MMFDYLKMYFEYDFEYNGIVIHQPHIEDIIRFGENGELGENDFYNTLGIFVYNPTTYRIMLWDMGIDWNKITDFELFTLLYKNANQIVLKKLFGNTLDIKNFEVFIKEKSDGTKERLLYNEKTKQEFTEENFFVIRDYLRKMFSINPKTEKIKGKMAKEMAIDMEKEDISSKKNNVDSTLFPLISACLNHPGFKYKKSELLKMGIVEFMDCVNRLQVYEQSTALLKGMYSGFVDTSKIDSENYNFMKNIYD